MGNPPPPPKILKTGVGAGNCQTKITRLYCISYCISNLKVVYCKRIIYLTKHYNIMKGDFKVIEKTYYNGTQSVEFKGIYEYKTFKVKVHIDVDAYDMQSSARVWVFNTNTFEWKLLNSIPYGHMASLQKDERDCEAVFYQTKVQSDGSGLRHKERVALDQDINDLLFKAENIL